MYMSIISYNVKEVNEQMFAWRAYINQIHNMLFFTVKTFGKVLE